MRTGVASGVTLVIVTISVCLALKFSIGHLLEVGVWRKLDAQGIPVGREGHACELVGNSIFVHGGRSNIATLQKSMHILDLDTLKWRTVIPDDKAIVARTGHSMTRVNDKLYIFGGRTTYFSLSGEMITFDPTTDLFKALETKGNAPSPRQHHSAVAIEKRIFIYGGTGGNRLSDLFVFDTERNEWIQPKTGGTAPGELEGHKAIAHGKKMYIFGGHNTKQFNSRVFVLDTETMTWSVANTESTIRSYHSTTRVGSLVYVLGGSTHDAQKLGDLKAFDVDTQKWIETTTPGETISPRQGHCAVLSHRTNQMYVFGGGISWNSYFGDLWVLDPESSTMGRKNANFPATSITKDSDGKTARMDLSKLVDVALNSAQLSLSLYNEDSAGGETSETPLSGEIHTEAEIPSMVGIKDKIAAWRKIGTLYDRLEEASKNGSLKNFTTEISIRTASISRIQKERVSLKEQLQQQYDDLKSSQGQLKSLEELVADLVKRMADAVAKQSRLADQVRLEQQSLEEAKAKKKEKQKSAQRAESQRDTLKSHLDRLESAYKGTFESYDNAAKRKGAVESLLESARTQLNNATEKEYQLQQSRQELAPVVGDLQRRVTRLTALNTDVEALKKKYDASRRAHEEYQNTKEAVLDKLKEEITGSRNTDANTELPEDDMWINEILSRQEQQSRETLSQKQANLSVIIENIKTTQQRIRELKDDEARLVLQQAEIAIEMKNAEQERKDKNKQIESAQAEWKIAFSAVEREHDELRQISDIEIPNKEQQLNRTRTDVKTVEQEVSELHEQESAARKELSKLQITLSSKLDELTDSSGRFSTQLTSMDTLRREIQSIQARYESEHASISQDRKHLQQLIEAVESDWRTKVTKLEAEVTSLRAKVQA